MTVEISGGLVVRDKKLLMVEDDDGWNIPAVEVSGEICADAAREITEELTGCSCEVSRYESRLKTRFQFNGQEFVWQPYLLDINGEPDEGEWVPLAELTSRDLVQPLDQIKDKLVERL